MSFPEDVRREEPGPELLRIGEMGRRLNATPEVLRAWERRYGLFNPERTPGGFRLYTPLDRQRAEAMLAGIAEGSSPAESARRAIASWPAGGAATTEADAFMALRQSIETMDSQGAGKAFDSMVRSMSAESVVSHVVMPIMRDIGELWLMGSISIAQEHFATAFFRSRLLALAEGWEDGERLALLACAPEEQHDLPLICLGLGLHTRSWAVNFLGTRTPAESVLEAADRQDPAAIVVSCTVEEGLDEGLKVIASAPPDAPVFLVGQATTAQRASIVGTPHIPSCNPMAVARWIDEEMDAEKYVLEGKPPATPGAD